MIEALKNEDIVNKVGGRFKLTALVQRRLGELLQGQRPLVDREPGMTDIELVLAEIDADKIGIDYDASDIPTPKQLLK
jgi:DNA-directed RNA polymerase subunit omega